MNQTDETQVMLKMILEAIQITNAKLDASIKSNKEEFAAVRAEIADVKAEMKQDVADLRVEMKQDIADLRAETKQDIADLRAEFKQDIADLRVEMKQDIADVRSEMATRKDMEKVIRTVIYLRDKVMEHDQAIHHLRRKRRFRFRGLI